MPPKWTGEAVKMMHLNNITRRDVAEEIGTTEQCLSYWIRGDRTPEYAEEKVMSAIRAIIANRNA